MKNLLLSIAAIFVLLTSATAQEFGFEKGSKFIEGNIRISNYEVKSEEKEKTTIISPKFGYFIKDNLAVGVDFMFMDHVKEYKPDGISEKAHGYGVGVFGRYYFLNIGSRFKTYAQLNATYGNTHHYSYENDEELRSPDFITYQAGGDIGFNFFVTKRLSINYSLGELLYFGTAKHDTPGAIRENTFKVNLNSFNNIFSDSYFGLSFKF